MSTDLTRTPAASPANAMGQERDKLKKSLRRIDLVFITLAALIAIDTIAVTAAVGAGAHRRPPAGYTATFYEDVAMTRAVTLAATQFACGLDVQSHLGTAERLVREAA